LSGGWSSAPRQEPGRPVKAAGVRPQPGLDLRSLA
jgi:hypothetical protein